MIIKTLGDFTILGMNHTAFIILVSILLVILALACYFLFSFIVVKKDQVVIIEHRKKYKRTLQPGVHMSFIFFENPVCAISLSKEIENDLNIEKELVVSKYKVCFSVINPQEYYYRNTEIMSELNNHLREIIKINISKYSEKSFAKNLETIKTESIEKFTENNDLIKSIKIENLYLI